MSHKKFYSVYQGNKKLETDKHARSPGQAAKYIIGRDLRNQKSGKVRVEERIQGRGKNKITEYSFTQKKEPLSASEIERRRALGFKPKYLKTQNVVYLKRLGPSSRA